MSTEENKIEITNGEPNQADNTPPKVENPATPTKVSKEPVKQKPQSSAKDVFEKATRKLDKDIVDKLKNDYKSTLNTIVADENELYDEIVEKANDYKAEEKFKKMQEAEALKINTEINDVLKKAGVENLDAIIDEIAIANGYGVNEKGLMKNNPLLLKNSIEAWEVAKIKNQPLPKSSLPSVSDKDIEKRYFELFNKTKRTPAEDLEFDNQTYKIIKAKYNHKY